ncbi:MAG: hypothetical protein EA400_15320 [Chromatiaceae bacterium]|nr:MAG: hypothetical protein EA400_15320 [Chromatiaceae bacterium]
MTQTITAAFAAIGAARNAVDELISAGFDQDKVFLDKEPCHVKVMVPDTAQPEVEEILRRHEPTEVWARPVE